MYKNDVSFGYLPKHTPTSLLAFKITDSKNNQIYSIDFDGEAKATININATVHLDQDYLNGIDAATSREKIYLIATAPSASGAYISMQKIKLPIKKLKQSDSNLVNLNYQLTVPDELKIDSLNQTFPINDVDIELSLTFKDENEMGHSEGLRVGTFLSTRIPVVHNVR